MSSLRSSSSSQDQQTLPQPKPLEQGKGVKRVILVFVDGFGLGKADKESNPIFRYRFPGLERDLGPFFEMELGQYRRKEKGILLSIDACLGVEGLPQSATGTAALLCGRNFPQMMGKHLSGFPPASLRELIAEDNLLLRLKNKGISAVFANAYRKGRLTKYKRKRPSVTTVVAQSAMDYLYDLDHLREGGAVYHDIDNSTLILQGYEVKYITPRKAGENLLAISRNYSFTLFEFFQTDLVGHSRDMYMAGKILFKLSEFIGGMADHLLEDTALIMASDHGNFEDLSVNGHTRNPVPLAILGPQPLMDLALDRVGDITHIAGLVEGWLGG